MAEGGGGRCGGGRGGGGDMAAATETVGSAATEAAGGTAVEAVNPLDGSSEEEESDRSSEEESSSEEFSSLEACFVRSPRAAQDADQSRGVAGDPSPVLPATGVHLQAQECPAIAGAAAGSGSAGAKLRHLARSRSKKPYSLRSMKLAGGVGEVEGYQERSGVEGLEAGFAGSSKTNFAQNLDSNAQKVLDAVRKRRSAYAVVGPLSRMAVRRSLEASSVLASPQVEASGHPAPSLSTAMPALPVRDAFPAETVVSTAALVATLASPPESVDGIAVTADGGKRTVLKSKSHCRTCIRWAWHCCSACSVDCC